MAKYLIEYGKVCELLGKVNGGYKVRITGDNEVTEKIVPYKPLVEKWKYDGEIFVKNGEVYARAEKYTTWNDYTDNIDYVYILKYISYPSEDIVREQKLQSPESEWKLVKKHHFLNREEVLEVLQTRDAMLKPYQERLEKLQTKIKEIEKKYSVSKKCQHNWVMQHEEEDGKKRVRYYICDICEQEREQTSYRLF